MRVAIGRLSFMLFMQFLLLRAARAWVPAREDAPEAVSGPSCATECEPRPGMGALQRSPEAEDNDDGPSLERAMTPHRSIARFVLLPALLVLAIGANARSRNVTDPDAPRALPEQGPVSVRWEDPSGFSEIRYSHNAFESRRGNWVEELAMYLRDRAQPRLPAGERLDITITNIELAGDYEPWHGLQFQDTRFIREIYPPRLALTFTRTDANGAVIATGERKLSDAGFMMSSSTSGFASDPLRFEKALIDRWLYRELPSPDRRVSRR
jgi:hypothetical protein